MFVLANMWFKKLMIQFFFNVDKIVYNFISSIYDLLISIARTSILSQAEIAEFADRIYKLLAVFMIFKVTFSLIMYVVNPDDFSDRSKGISKLGTNIVISLCLLVLSPYIFNYAYELQTIILEENTLAKLVIGDESNSSYLNTAGDEMAYIAISPFFYPNVSMEELYECSNLVIKDTDGEVKFNPSCSGLANDSDYSDLNDENSLMTLTSEDFFQETTLRNYVAGVNSSNFGLMFREDLALATDPENDYFIMDYKYIFSTVVGVVIILLLLTFCMDIAVRSIKLSFLQLIAPIPIISYVDPKSGKDGMFKKWYQMCFSTYLSLFIRLLALYFAIYIISKVADLKMYDLIDGSTQTNNIIGIFIIIGALMFAKQLPKILEGLGIKLDGNGFTLNPLKKMENDMIGGKKIVGFGKGVVGAAGAMGAATLASGAGAIGNIRSRWHSTDNEDKWKLVAGGLTSGLSAGLKAGAKGMVGAVRGEKFGKNFTNSYKQAMSSEKTRMDRISDGVGAGELMVANLQQSLGIRTKGEKVKYASEAYKNVSEKYTAARNNILAADGVAKDLDAQLKVLEATSISRESFYRKDSHGRIIDGTFDETAYNVAINELTKRKKQLGDAIDKRVKDIMTGSSVVRTGGTGTVDASGIATFAPSGDELETNTAYVRQLNEEMVKEGILAENVAHSIDSDFGGAKIDRSNPKGTAKSSQTASSAISTGETASHATRVGKYTKNNNSKN